MRRRTLGVKKEPTIMIIPMIDIVFFLLVFFMVGTLYMNTEQQIPLNLPSTSTSTAKSIEPIIITLTTSHKLYIDNREISADNLSQEVQDICLLYTSYTRSKHNRARCIDWPYRARCIAKNDNASNP